MGIFKKDKFLYDVFMLIVAGGPMFAGKTTWLLSYLQDLPEGTFQLFKPNIDTRYGKHEVVSHNGKRFPALNLRIDNPDFSALKNSTSHILIDELNFFHPDKLLPVIKRQLNAGKTIVGVGLMYDFLRKPFGATIHLKKIADKFIQLYATCDRCKKKARHSYRKIAEKAQVVVGAAESYGPCCLSCWKRLQV